MHFAGIFSIVVGVGMVGQWGFTYVTKQIPELKTEPIRIWFHIAAEMVTAVLLIIGGIGLLRYVPWGEPLFLIAMGMLFYTAIVSPGYFAQRGEWAWLGMFSLILLLGVFSIVMVLV